MDPTSSSMASVFPPTINDKTLFSARFITAKPILQRLDVFPFIFLYSLLLGFYFNTELDPDNEWIQIIIMITILTAVVVHIVILLMGYWHVTFRIKLAYTVHSQEQILKAFKSFNKATFTEGIRFVQDEYESSLTLYKMWYSFYEKKYEASKSLHKKGTEAYNRHPNPENAIPPGPFVPPEPPKSPQLGNPVVIFQGKLLEVCVQPKKHHGNPIITRCIYDIADKTRAQYHIMGIITPEDAVKGRGLPPQSTILISGPPIYPPLKFSFHHTNFLLDPNATIDGNALDISNISKNDKMNASNISTTFQRLQYPDDDKLINYLSHKYTAAMAIKQNAESTTQHGTARQNQQIIPNSSTISTSSGRSSTYKLLQYGLNSLTVPIPSFLTIFIENAMSPFFVFQIICILLWCLDEYWYYSLFTLFMIVALECTVVYKRQSHLSQMLGEKPPLPHVYVYRQIDSSDSINTSSNSVPGEWDLISTKQLVPGDIIALSVYNDRSQSNKVYGPLLNTDASFVESTSQQSGASNVQFDTQADFKSGKPSLFTTDIPCDLLLLSGSCVCDESMLTGESVPQVKEDLLSLQTAKDASTTTTTTPGSPQYNPITGNADDELVVHLDQKAHKRYMLYAGTKLIGVQRNYQHSFFTPSISSKTQSIIQSIVKTTPQSKKITKSANIDDIDGDEDENNQDLVIDEEDVELEESYVLSDKKQNLLTLVSKPPIPNGTDIVLCRVLRTGFSTTQGSLVRTILTATDLVLVDREALYFILGLLAVAMISAYFVLIEGLADKTRSRYKLLLNVITILTSVVPPELPMQLSMAVNNALASLAKTQVFCTEPNRLPNAGQLDVCCFDKTGTLTSDSFLLTCAVTYHNDNCNKDKANDETNNYAIIKKDEDDDDDFVDGNDDIEDSSFKSLDLHHLPVDMRLILGSAHELAMLQLPPKQLNQQEQDSGKKNPPRQKIVGDPMESVAFEQAGFHFMPRQTQPGAQADHNSNNKVFCDANLTYLNSVTKSYQTVPTALLSQSNSGLNSKMRFDVEIVHRFPFQSQLQRMSSIIQVSPPSSKLSTANTDYNALIQNNSNFHWLNTTLPQMPPQCSENETMTIRDLASKTYLRCVVKGSPEMIYTLLHPDHRPDYDTYTTNHKKLARQGLRVLALAWKPLFVDQNGFLNDLPGMHTNLSQFDTKDGKKKLKGSIEYQQEFYKKHQKATQNVLVSSYKVPSRDICEQGLFFGGIIGFNSPLKTQSFEVIQHLQESRHKTIMITGDHLLTAIAVAKQLSIAKENCLLLSKSYVNSATSQIVEKLVWLNEHEEYVKDFTPNDPMFNDIQSKSVIDQDISLCINGDSLIPLFEQYSSYLPLITSCTSVFARTLPDQKELILKHLKEHNGGQFTLMCGDGTNDVGALTHANIGIALSSIDTDSKEQISLQETKLKEMSKNPIIKRQLETSQKLREKGFIPQAETMEKQAHDNFKRFKQSQFGKLMDSMGDEEEEADGSVKLGDASLAASFSAKHGSIRCVLDVIRQGRCALATTGQMYQILALQCLIAAYSLSALYFKGVRQSESQMTVSGMVGAVMSMLLSNAQPLEKVSPRRPNSKIFSPYNMTTIGLQFAVHLSILMYMVNYAMEFTDIDLLKHGQDEIVTKYIPSVLNTVVFVLSTAMSATTILSNYVGFPFMTPLTWTPLFKLIIGTLVVCCALSMESMPEINEMLEMSPMPNQEFSMALTHSIVIDCIGCLIIGLGTKLFFGILTWDDLTKPIPKNVISHSITKATLPSTTTTRGKTKSSTSTISTISTSAKNNKKRNAD